MCSTVFQSACCHTIQLLCLNIPEQLSLVKSMFTFFKAGAWPLNFGFKYCEKNYGNTCKISTMLGSPVGRRSGTPACSSPGITFSVNEEAIASLENHMAQRR